MTQREASVVLPEISNGGAGAWFVRGPAGSGKSWLLEHVAAALADRDVRWLRTDGVRADAAFGSTLTPPIDASTDAAALLALRGAAVLVDDLDLLPDGLLVSLASVAATATVNDILLVTSERVGCGRRATARVATSCVVVSLSGLDPLRPSFRQLVGDPDPEGDAALLRATDGWYELVAVHPSIADVTDAHDLVRPRLAAASERAQHLALVLAFGASLADGSAEELGGSRGEELDALVAELDGVGLLHGGRMAELVADSLRAITPVGRRRRLLTTMAEAGSVRALGRLADWLLGTDDRSPEALDILVAAARDRAPEDAVRLLEVAVEAGAGPDAKAQLADALLRAGRPADAVAMAAGGDRSSAVLRAALARGARAGDAARVEPDRQRLQAALVAASLGRTGEAREIADGVIRSPIGADAAAAALLDATIGLVEGAASAAVAARDARRLSRDGVDTSDWVLDPVTCAVIASTEAADADERVDDEPGTAFAALARVVAAWQSMRAGRFQEAVLGEERDLEPLEAAVATVVDAALALRADQLDTLPALVAASLRALEGIQLDVWRLPLMVEIVPAAARAGIDAGRLLAEFRDLAATGVPGSLLELACARADLVAGIAADDVAAVHRAAARFAGAGGGTPAHALWASVVPVVEAVFDDTVDADAVLAAAAALRDAGLVFEAGRLTGAAALRCDDERTAKALLRESRAIRHERKATAGGRRGDVTELSEREVEVARLVLQGRTHKEVGATLFISAKTVEHHVARIRNKLGASSRAEMMAAIRDYLAATDDIDAPV